MKEKSASRKLIYLVIRCLMLMNILPFNCILHAEEYKPFNENSGNMWQSPQAGTSQSYKLSPLAGPQPKLLSMEGTDDGDALGIVELPVGDGLLILAGLGIPYLVIVARRQRQKLNKNKTLL